MPNTPSTTVLLATLLLLSPKRKMLMPGPVLVPQGSVVQLPPVPKLIPSSVRVGASAAVGALVCALVVSEPRMITGRLATVVSGLTSVKGLEPRPARGLVAVPDDDPEVILPMTDLAVSAAEEMASRTGFRSPPESASSALAMPAGPKVASAVAAAATTIRRWAFRPPILCLPMAEPLMLSRLAIGIE
ncbi:MAG: hypothetical protein ACRDU5_00510 [Mycobacterium sp.]